MFKMRMLVVVLVLLVAACGGGGTTTDTSDAAANADTTAEAAPTTTPTTTTSPDTTTTTLVVTTAVATTTTITTSPTTSTTSGAPATTLAPVTSGNFCDNVNTLLGTNDQLLTELYSGDTSNIGDLLQKLPELAEAARQSAPPEMADDFELIVTFIGAELVATEDVDLSDAEAVVDAIDVEMDDATSQAFAAMFDHAGEECGYSSGLDLEEPSEPPACETLDAKVAADAAGVNIDTSESSIGGSFSLPGFAIKGCGYDGGRMVLSTLTYTDLATIVGEYPSNVENNGGEIIDADLGSLPASSLVARQNGVVTVTVFEADTPFAVGFGDGVAPAKVVAAAEALLTSLSPPK